MTTNFAFKEMHRVGRDALGDLWQAKRGPGEPAVRIRVFTSKLINDPDIQSRLINEVGRIQRFSHPNLAVVRDSGIEDGNVFVVSDWMDGLSLAEHFEKRIPLDERTILRMAQDVARGLACAWEATRRPHGQLTPAGILLATDGRAIVTDLGQSGVGPLRDAGSRNLLALLQTQPCHVAPELVQGTGEPDQRADIYALGTVLYQAFTGAAPFGDKPPAEALDKHLFGTLTDPLDLPGTTISMPAAWLLEKLLVRDPRARYADWAAVLADLAEVLNGRIPPGPRPEPGQSVIRRSSRREARAGGPAAKPSPFAPIAPGKAPLIQLPPAPPAGRPSPFAPPPVPPAARPPSPFAPPPTPVPGLGADGKAKSKIVLNEEMKQSIETARRTSQHNHSQALTTALLLLAAAAAAIYYFVKNPPPEAPSVAVTGELEPLPEIYAPVEVPDADVRAPAPGAARKPPVVAAVRPVAPDGTEPTIATGPAPLESTEPAPMASADPLLRNPSFQRGAQLFNAALALFKKFETEQNAAHLTQIPAMCDQAAAAFEACRPIFPGDPRVDKYVQQCYGLTRYARQSALMHEGAQETRRSRHTTAALPAPPSSVQGGGRPLRPVLPGLAGDALKLGPAWNMPLRPGTENIARDLRELLGGRGRPQVDLKAGEPIELASGLPYLAPMDQAAGSLGLNPPEGPGKDLASVGLPENSLRYYEYGGKFEERFGLLRMVVDTFGHVTALQYADETPQPQTWLPEPIFSSHWVTTDPLLSKIKERPNLRVAHRVRQTGRRLVIESEVADLSADAGAARSLARSVLYLPQPMVDLILLRLGSTAP